MKIQQMRREYHSEYLNETGMDSNPINQFRIWLEAAITFGLSEPNSMVLASATLSGRPSARVVLLKGINDNGFVFYTNYMSRKGSELLSNPFAAAVFDWHEIERQVRIEGLVEKVEDAESDAYFKLRPNNSKIGAWASPQSRIVKDRNELEALQKKYAIQFADSEIPRPALWGGFLIRPTVIEFWQGRPNRLHDRMAYYKVEKGWSLQRLAP